jgi:hypothetical protein
MRVYSRLGYSQVIPQLAEIKTPLPVDAAGESLLYDEFVLFSGTNHLPKSKIPK